MGAKSYVAVIGDVVASRRAPDRSALQARLEEAMREVNAQFSGEIAAQFILTLGDEFQGLLHSPNDLAGLLARVRLGVHPAEMRFGIGIGGLETALRAQTIGMDGACLQRARLAVERAKRSGTRLEVEAGRPSAALQIYSQLISALRLRWTDRQRQVLDHALAGMEGKQIAAVLGISPPAVSQHLSAAGMSYVRAAEKAWMAELQFVFDRAQEDEVGDEA